MALALRCRPPTKLSGAADGCDDGLRGDGMRKVSVSGPAENRGGIFLSRETIGRASVEMREAL